MADQTTMDLTGIDLVAPGISGQASGNSYDLILANKADDRLVEFGDYTSRRQRIQGRRTTDATETVFESVGNGSTFANTMIVYEAKVMARKTDDASRRFWWLVGMFSWDSSSVLSQVGSTQDVVPSQDDSATAWEALLSMISDSVCLKIKGAAATNIDWNIDVSYSYVKGL